MTHVAGRRLWARCVDEAVAGLVPDQLAVMRVAVQLDNEPRDFALQDFVQLVDVGRRLRQATTLCCSASGEPLNELPIPDLRQESPALNRVPSLVARRSCKNNAKPAFSSSSSSSVMALRSRPVAIAEQI